MNEQTPPGAHSELPKLLAEVIGRLNALEQEAAALRNARPSLASLAPYTRPTDEELQDMLHGPRATDFGIDRGVRKEIPGG